MKRLFRVLDELFYWNGERLPKPLAALRAFAWQWVCGPEPEVDNVGTHTN